MDKFREYGKTGLFRFNTGWIYEEFLKELQGRKGVEVYKEMAENDDVIGAILFATEMLMRQSDWSIQEAGTTQQDLDAAEFVRTCMDDMEETWSDFISEVLSFLPYGWSYHEIVYKRRMGNTRNPETRSKYDDGLIGWRKLPIRSQDTLWEWKYDERDNLIGLIQCAPPMYEQVFIPLEKALHFKTKSRKGNPEGRSILRNSYRDWYFKRRIQEIEGIGMERDLAGLPVLEAPEGVDIWSDEYREELAKAESIVRSVRRDEREGIVLGNGWKFTLTSTGGRRQFDTNQIIERYDTRMAMTVLADFVLLGHQNVGSFALSSDKTELFGVALGAFLDLICEVFNKQAREQLRTVTSEMFDNCYALSDSFCSIICDKGMDADAKEAMMLKSLDEFAQAIRSAAPQWAKGQKATKPQEVQAGIQKSAAQQDALAKLLGQYGLGAEQESTIQEPQGEKEETDTMKIDKSKMTPEEQATLAEFEKKYGIAEPGEGGGTPAPETTPAGGVEKGAEQPATPTPTPAPAVPNGALHPDVAKALSDFQAFTKQQSEEIETLKKSLEIERLTAIAGKYEVLGKKAPELAEKLYTLKKAGGTVYDDYVALLDESLSAVTKGGMFGELGSSRQGSAGTEQTLGIKAAELSKSAQGGMTTPDAIIKAWEENPELAAQYEAEYSGR